MINEAAMTFGRKLRQLREELGWSQDELGERAGLHGRHVGRLEIGGALPGTATLLALARALGASIDGLLGNDQERRSTVRPEAAQDRELGRRMRQLARLPEEERRAIFAVIEAFAARRRRGGRPRSGA
jgi:transcriptional regulator with XRE-family HTH domain